MDRLLRMALLLSMMLMLSGCWNRREINDLVIAVGMGIDKVPEGYHVSIQVVDPGEVSAKKGSGRAPVALYKGTGKTVFDAIRSMTSTSARKIHFSHLRIFVIGEETARTEGIGSLIEYVFRDHEFREDYYITIARKIKAEEILKGLTAIEKIPANKLFTSLEMSSKTWAATGTMKIDELISDLMSEGKSSLVTGIHYTGDISKAGKKENVEVTEGYARLKYGGMAVFRKDKLVGWLDEEESKGYNYVHGKVINTVGVVNCPKEKGNVSIEIKNLISNIQVNWRDHTPALEIRLTTEGSVGEVQCGLDPTDPAVLRELEKLSAKKLEGFIRKALGKGYSLEADFIGLGAAIHRSDAKAWAKLKEDWNKQMSSYPVTVKVSVKLRATGKTTEAFLKKMKE
ncbi:Ger(x)C family spore germination protein [Paenibacillus puerhi]|uniref:Ger(x)C family spore germination protein n=1 Tax=Paenibacillus puerhi TaxID=2692622 RepID=UPI00135676F4|nr:Ger(x)C family spore germination protein [Paenibacillus puerhi]